MYRLKIKKITNSPKVYRVKSKKGGVEKIVKITSLDHSDYSQIKIYSLQKACKEAIRDLLYLDFGGNWRAVEMQSRSSIEKSINRAMKFAR